MELSPTPRPEARTHAADRPSLHLRDLASVMRQRARMFLGVTAGVTLFVIGLTLLITPVYESEASLRIRMDDSGGLGASMMSGLAGLGDVAQSIPGLSLPGGLGETDVQTEMDVLGSRLIVESLAESLALHVSLSRPWGAFRTDVLHVLSAGEDAPRGTYSLKRQSDGSYSVSARGTRQPVTLPEQVRIGEPFAVGPMMFSLVDSLAADPPSLIRFKVDPFRRMMRSLRSTHVKIERSGQGSRLVEISYRNPDPQLAQALVNGIVDDFMDYSLSTSQSDSRRRVVILEQEVHQYRGALAEAEAQLQGFQERERVIHPEEQATQQVRRIAEIQLVYDAAQVERAALARTLEQLAQHPATPSGETRYRSLASFPTFITNQGVQQLLARLSDLENQRAQLLVRRNETNADVVALNSRIREIEEQIFSLATEYLEGLDTQIASAAAALQGYGNELEAIPAVELEYLRLTREQRLLGEVYLMLQGQLVDAQVQLAIDEAQMRVVDRGVIEDRPVFPRRSITFALAGIMGLMVGLFTVVSVETSSPRLRTGSDAARVSGVPLLAAVPLVRGQEKGRALFLRHEPTHEASEAVRALALQLRSGKSRPQVVVIGGMSEGEGRSTVAANVALALARQGARTALVDADLRNGVLGRWFGARDGVGWPEQVTRGEDPAAAGQRVEDGATGGYLDLFSGGSVTVHPLEVLVSDRVPAFVQALRGAYDVVVVDTPPLAAGHDGTVMAGLADGSILVGRAHVTDEAGLRTAAEALGREQPVLGVVLNGAHR